MEKFRQDNILKIENLESELELEYAFNLYRSLRLMMKVDPSAKESRKHLANLIEAYEDEHWSDDSKITDEQVKESDEAEKLIEEQNIDFYEMWKSLKWREFKSDKVRTFQLDEEPEIIYVINIRKNEYMVVHEDGYDQNTGKVRFYSKNGIKNDYGIEL